MNGNLMQMVVNLRNNPTQFLASRGVDIPKDMTNPDEIISYLMRTGKISQAQYDRAVKMAQQFR
jgi:hypothetical protein